MGDKVKHILARPIQLADQVIKAADEAASFKQECSELKSRTAKLADLLRQAARASAELYERPTSRIISDTVRVLERALALAVKCRSANGFLKRAFTLIPAAAFRKLFSLLDNSVGDISWLLRVSAPASDSIDYLGLPPIAANEPILCLIWEQIAILHTGSLDARSDAAASLVSLARDNDRYGSLIIEEGGVAPLLRLLKDGRPHGQENAARAVGLLARDPESVDHMVLAGVCSVFAKILKDGPMRVQAMVAWAVSGLAAHSAQCRDLFAQHNVVRLLVSHLAFETIQEHSKYDVASHKPSSIHQLVLASSAGAPRSAPDPTHDDHSGNRLHSVVTMATHPKGPEAKLIKDGSISTHPHHTRSPSRHSLTASRVRECEDPDTKANMKSMAARALWHLAKDNSAICRSITESRALLCFAVLLDKGADEIRCNSAMALMEITSVAAKDADLRRSAFKPNSPACKAVVDQLLKVIEKADSDSDLLIPCIKAIGNLARTFKATETRMIEPLVKLLDEREPEVSAAAAVALAMFAGSDNYLHMDHSKAIIEAGGIKHLVQLVYFGELMVQLPALVLISYIAKHVPEGHELADNQVLNVLDWASKQSHLTQDENRETLLLEAKSRVELYQTRGSR